MNIVSKRECERVNMFDWQLPNNILRQVPQGGRDIGDDATGREERMDHWMLIFGPTIFNARDCFGYGVFWFSY
jgi:hypothetical protein